MQATETEILTLAATGGDGVVGLGSPGAAISNETWASAMDLPCDVAVCLPAPGLRVRDLLGLSPGFLVRTKTPVSADVPLEVNGQLVAWCEFEVAHDRLAVRLTELA